MKFTKHTCCEIVFHARLSAHPCGKTAGYEFEGKRYCLRHHPENVLQKQKVKNDLERQKQHQESVARDNLLAAKAEVERKAACYDDLLAALQAVSAYCGTGVVPADINAVMKAAISRATGEA